MPVRQSKYIAGVMTIAALGTGAVMAPVAHAALSAGDVQMVREGQSIQAAVDAAPDGGTVLVRPGTYRESVQITRNVTLRGVGAGVTITAPGATGRPDATAPEAGRPDAPAASRPDAPQAGRPDAPAASRPNGPAAGRPDATVTAPQAGRPDAPAASRPNGPAAGRPDATVTAPQAGRPNTPATLPAGAMPAAPAATPNGTAPSAAMGETSTVTTTTTATTTQRACAAAGHGICVTGRESRPLTAVRIESITVTGFRANGIDVSGTDGMVIRQVAVRNNGQQGISQERSTRAVLRDNQAVGNGQSGILVANRVNTEGGALDTRGTVIAGNTLTGNRIGVTVRRARVLTVENNTVTANCGGVFVVGDENTPKAGDLDIRQNKITDNNRFCAATDRLPAIQGTGVLLSGAEDTRITGNTVTGNSGASPMSGGVVLYPSTVGVANMRNQVNSNVLSGNRPADLADRDTRGSGNTFSANTCSVSEPAGRC